MDIKQEFDPTEADIGVIISRFQVHELHEAHIDLIKKVLSYHKKVIVFLGIPVIENTKRNPLDFASRKAMVQAVDENIVVLPLKDQRSNEVWSRILDDSIRIPFGDKPAILYGSRDSFIPYYKGKYQTAELTTTKYISGTEVRNQISKELRNSADFRAGVIHATYTKRPTTWSTVDVCPFNKDGQILLGKKPNENQWRFIGGFVDPTDGSDEDAARRELREEAGAIEVGPMEYITSQKVDDWRYRQTEDGIMTRLFITEYLWGRIEPSDDISELLWVDIDEVDRNLSTMIMEEHQQLMVKLITLIKNNKTQIKYVTTEKN